MHIDQSLINSLLLKASESERKRTFLNLHQSFAEPVQRVLIAILADSYVVPHQHPNAGQFELFLVLSGEIDLIEFADDGTIKARQTIGAGMSQVGVELPPGVWHSLVAKGDGAVFMEIKAGPFDPSAPRHFAKFAPEEKSELAIPYLQWLKTASVGQCFAE